MGRKGIVLGSDPAEQAGQEAKQIGGWIGMDVHVSAWRFGGLGVVDGALGEPFRRDWRQLDSWGLHEGLLGSGGNRM